MRLSHVITEHKLKVVIMIISWLRTLTWCCYTNLIEKRRQISDCKKGDYLWEKHRSWLETVQQININLSLNVSLNQDKTSSICYILHLLFITSYFLFEAFFLFFSFLGLFTFGGNILSIKSNSSKIST